MRSKIFVSREAHRVAFSRASRAGFNPVHSRTRDGIREILLFVFLSFFDTLRLCVGPYRGGQKTIISLWKDKGAGKDFVSRIRFPDHHTFTRKPCDLPSHHLSPRN